MAQSQYLAHEISVKPCVASDTLHPFKWALKIYSCKNYKDIFNILIRWPLSKSKQKVLDGYSTFYQKCLLKNIFKTKTFHGDNLFLHFIYVVIEFYI